MVGTKMKRATRDKKNLKYVLQGFREIMYSVGSLSEKRGDMTMFSIWHTEKQADPKAGTKEIRPTTEGFRPFFV